MFDAAPSSRTSAEEPSPELTDPIDCIMQGLRRSDVRLIKAGFEKGFQMDELNAETKTSLLHSVVRLGVEKGDVEAIKIGIENGHPVDTLDAEGKTALLGACFQAQVPEKVGG